MSSELMGLEYAPVGLVSPTQYQDEVLSTVIYDDNGTTIRGLLPELTFLAGMYEEYAETLEYDRPFPQYSRIGMVTLENADVDRLAEYHSNDNQPDLLRHQKEFGDLLWYTTALAGQLGVELHEIVGASFDDIDRQAPGYFGNENLLRTYCSSFCVASLNAAGLINNTNDALYRECFVQSSRMLLMAVSSIAQKRLGTDLGAIAQQNLEKLRRRMRNNTINCGRGDDR